MMKVLEHEHPLKLVDLQVTNNEESDDDEDEKKDLVPQPEFGCSCNRCGQEINEYYRYYYKCSLDDDSCDYSLHKFCAELPTTLHDHVSHPHPLELHEIPYKWECEYCKRKHNANEVGYKCLSHDCFSFKIDVICAVEAKRRMIHHPSHPHPLVCFTTNSILCECRACGKEHKGFFFQCTTCSGFAIHTECAFLSKTLLIQHTTNAVFQHTHPLTLSYSFSKVEQSTIYYQSCRVCGDLFTNDYYNLWFYKCEKCMYYAHLDCATSRKEPFMSMLSSAIGQTIKNFKDADYPDILRLPFPDQSYSILKHLFFKETEPSRNSEVSLQHINHQHELTVVDTTERIGSTMCHNPMKKIQLLCNGCVRPIIEVPFYKCGDEGCKFVLHQWCNRLPKQIDNHPGHPQHTLILLSNVPGVFFSIFTCALCELPCNGFSYGCVECGYYIDVNCGFIPEKITHKSHPNHLLLLGVLGRSHSLRYYCHICKRDLTDSKVSYYSCNVCDVYIHRECALFLPETVTHIYDKHPMHLNHLPVENHKSEYFCEICEHKLVPYLTFYHCDKCAQSVHSACAPLILQSETDTYSQERENPFYKFSNVKFRSILKTDGHPHPLSFAQGIESDGECSMCSKQLRYKMIFKCLDCKFAIEDKCCKRLNTS